MIIFKIECILLCLASILFTPEAFGSFRGNCISRGLSSNENVTSSEEDTLRVFCYGYVDFFSIYTRMKSTYPDYTYQKKNLTFAPYPDPGLINRNAEQPILFFATEGFKGNTRVKVNFNLVHSFNGFDESFSKSIIFRMPPSFEVINYAPFGTFTFTAGDCTGKTHISPFTLSGQSLVTHPFERLPWDWYPATFNKYSSIYDSYSNPLKVLGLNASQGFLFSGDQIFRRFGFKLFYGRTNFSMTPVQVQQKLPAYILAGKTTYANGRYSFSLNSYHREIFSDPLASKPESNNVTTIASQGPIGTRSGWEMEIGFNRNSMHRRSDKSVAIRSGLHWTSKVSEVSVQLNGFYIPYNFVSIDNAVLNTNYHVTISGIPDDHAYNLTLFINPVQLPDVMSNNRTGIMLMTGSNKGKFRFSLEQGLSREIEHHHDSITFFHHTNSFTRSRFTPWLQDSGPYHRVGGRYRYTTETIPYTTQGKPFYFYSGILRLKYKSFLLGREHLLLVTPGVSAASTEMFSDDTFNSYYLDISSFYRVGGKINLVSFLGIQSNSFDKMLPLSLKQQSRVWGIGADIEFARNAAFHVRYKRFIHRDLNYLSDHFKGEEITTEVKIFF